MNRKLFLSTTVMLLTLSGCGEKGIEVVPVSGKVTWRGQPTVGAQVVLHPVSAGAQQTFSATGRVRDDGTFNIGVNVAGDGAPPGDYVATVQWFKVVETKGAAGQGPNVLPAKYGSAETSPLKVKVNETPTDLPPWELK